MKFICFLIAMMIAAASARAEDITAMISQYRREHGLPAVKADPKLTAVAERQAQAMASSGIMDHDVAGSFASRISGANVVTGAENIAAGTKTWTDTLRIWKESPGHNQNLLTPGADLLGVAVARNENTHYKVYWAMVIGRRDLKRKPGMAAAASAGGRGAHAARDAAAESSVGEWVNHAITSIKNLLP
jgi:Cysteine-rich secretory protein family